MLNKKSENEQRLKQALSTAPRCFHRIRRTQQSTGFVVLRSQVLWG